MSRLIDADALINTLNEGKIKFNADTNYIILNAPTIDAEPIRHGHWIMLHKTQIFYKDEDYDWRCSECNHVDCHNINVEVPYCWHCGARMDEVNDETYR